LITAANQQLTREWWEHRRSDFLPCVSEAVMREARAGDPQVAAKRSERAAGLPLLAITDEVISLAEALVRRGPLPPKAAAHCRCRRARGGSPFDLGLQAHCERRDAPLGARRV
jgi:hypothetical protein